MNIILKTTTHQEGGLTNYRVERLGQVDLTGFKFVAEHKYNGNTIYEYVNNLIPGHIVKIEVIQMDIETNFQRNIKTLQGKISHGKLGWTSLIRDLDLIIKGKVFYD